MEGDSNTPISVSDRKSIPNKKAGLEKIGI